MKNKNGKLDESNDKEVIMIDEDGRPTRIVNLVESDSDNRTNYKEQVDHEDESTSQ